MKIDSMVTIKNFDSKEVLFRESVNEIFFDSENVRVNWESISNNATISTYFPIDKVIVEVIVTKEEYL